MSDSDVCIALVGYGYWGPNLLRNYMELPGVRVKWVCDRNGMRLALAKSRFPSITVTDDFEDVLRDPETSAVVIATPISTHHHLSLAALGARKHVFVEKPLADSVPHAQAVVDRAHFAQRTLMVGHTFEYSPAVRKIKELLDAGELGDVYFICSSRVNLGLHQRDVSVIWDLAPHDFSILMYLLGEEPDFVSAFGRSCVKAANPDVAFVNLSFPSGAVAEVQLSWLSPMKLRRTIIVGSRKMLVYDDTEVVEKVKLFDHGVKSVDPGSFGEFQLSYRTGDIISPRLDSYEPLFAEAKHFVECVRTGARPRTDGLSGLRVVRALERADDSLMATGLRTVVTRLPRIVAEDMARGAEPEPSARVPQVAVPPAGRAT